MKKSSSGLQNSKVITAVFVFVVAYTILQLLWWGYLLHLQSREIAHYEEKELTHRIHQLNEPAQFMQEMQRLHHEERMRTFKYIGEGSIFLILILAGAVSVYRSVWKQMRLSRQQQNFMMAVTHELKSPIAAAKLNLETLRKHKLDEEKQLKLINNTIRETNRLDQLCSNILLAAQFEDQKYQPFLEDIDFSRLICINVEELQQRTGSHTIHADIFPHVWLKADTFMIQLMLNNLVENAVKYAPKGTTITVQLRTTPEGLKLNVNDEGEGIPSEERNKIFMKFYRIGNENTRKSKGSGLGLYLTKRIVEQHGGMITVKDNPPRGTSFEVTWSDYSVRSV